MLEKIEALLNKEIGGSDVKVWYVAAAVAVLAIVVAVVG